MSDFIMRPALFACACIGLLSTPAVAAAHEHPMLRICIDVTCTFAHSLDLDDLEEMEQASFATSTIWTEGTIEFQGVPLRALLDHADFTSGTLELIAANDYHVEIPVDEARDSPALIAYRMNGKLMSTRDKGPLWLVYPFDSDAKFQSEIYYSKSIWQIDHIKLLSE
ncbi:MAG: molybdopterin-dependent oxidoreductase [Roseovarius sp.]|nr:molybdopterin-dependent oxidoreductase [Roseovarius sp.]